MTTGMTLGKFAPLHKGHQLLIETSMRENSRTIVIIYDSPDVISISLETRANWIRRLYPAAEVLLAYGAPKEVGNSAEAMSLQENYVLELLGGRKIDAFYSSEFYGAHISKALHALDRRVDTRRERYPVSGTDLRLSPARYRDYVSPVVYRDMVTRVCLLGGPSTGKTTLAEALARRLGCGWMPEYGREYWEEHQVDRRLTAEQLVTLAKEHISREDSLLDRAGDYLICDTNAVTTLIFSYYYHGRALAELENMASQCFSRYDTWILCGDDFPFDDTWDRSGAASRDRIQKMTMEWLDKNGVQYHLVAGSIEDRVVLAESHARGFCRLMPALGI